jgi:hypothetical protein
MTMNARPIQPYHVSGIPEPTPRPEHVPTGGLEAVDHGCLLGLREPKKAGIARSRGVRPVSGGSTRGGNFTLPRRSLPLAGHDSFTLYGLTELRLSVPEAGKRLLPLPVALWHKDVGKRVLKPIAKGDDVLVYGQLVRRFYRSGAGARSLTEVVAAGIKKLEPVVTD